MIVVFGSGGFLGRHLCVQLEKNGAEHLAFSSKLPPPYFLDLNMQCQLPQLTQWKNVSHAVILNGITAIDACFRNPEQTWRFNVKNTISILDQLIEKKIVPVFVSSDMVFDGNSAPYKEDDERHPTTVYGQHKLEVENFLERSGSKHVIVRLSKLYSLGHDDVSGVAQVWRNLKNGNIVRAAQDQTINPTHVIDATQALIALINSKKTGVWHVSSQQKFTRYTLALSIADSLKVSKDLVEPIFLADLPVAEPRPRDNTLDCSKYFQINQQCFKTFSETLCVMEHCDEK